MSKFDSTPKTGSKNKFYKNFDDISRDVTLLSENDKLVLCAGMRDELRLFNTMVSGFNGLLKRNPNIFFNINDDIEKLIHYCVFNSISFKKLVATASALPEEFIATTKLVDDRRNRIIDKFQTLIDCASTSSTLNSVTRLAMFKQMFDHYKDQAKIMIQPMNSSSDQLYKTNIKLLGTLEIGQKRHMQLVRSMLKLSYDESKGGTFIEIPYLNNKIFVKSNIVEKDWQIAVIHQDPHKKVIDLADKWIIDFKKSNFEYLLDYMEQKSAFYGKSFFQAKDW